LTGTLLTGITADDGLVGVLAPDGVDAQSAQAIRRLVGPHRLLQVPAGPSEEVGSRPSAVVAGEIFNLGELAAATELPPTERVEGALEAGFKRWSHCLLRRLRGSFALVVIDPATGDGLIAADAAGAHSIFFHAKAGRLSFASEIHLLLKLLPTRPAPNRAAVVHWLCYESTGPVGETLYEGVDELMGGECFELSGGSWSRSRYWAPRYELPAAMTRPEAGEFLWSAFSGAVAVRLGSSEDVGILMSGGIDSSAVAAAAVAAAPARGSSLHTYSAVFPQEPALDDTDRIDQLVERFGLRNTQIRLEPGGGFALSLEWLATWELPLLDPAYRLDRPLLDLAAADGVTGFLDGQGGDESFGAPLGWLADLLLQGRIVSSLRTARKLPARGNVPWRAALHAWRSYGLLGAIPLRMQVAARRLRPYRDAPTFLTEENARLLVETDTVWNWKQLDAPRWWADKAYHLTTDRQAVGIKSYLRLRGALSGLRARSPLLDVDVIDALLRIPPQLEFDPVLDRVSIREGMAGRVPDSLRKSPWKSDLAPFSFDGLAGAEFAAMRGVLGPSAEIYAYTKPAAVRELADRRPRRLEGQWREWSGEIWRLATVECWLRSQSDPSFAGKLRDSGLPQPKWSFYRERAERTIESTA
jgi:asparagine synthase (glutamine-hydrolysing)